MKEELVLVNENNLNILTSFLHSIQNSKKTFQYFEKRGLKSIRNHLVTYILCENKIPIVYGHLDKEDDNIWLGICVADNYIGLGYGKKMMKNLINFASLNKLKKINLSVYKNNEKAINLYYNNGFKEYKITDNIIFMEKNI